MCAYDSKTCCNSDSPLEEVLNKVGRHLGASSRPHIFQWPSFSWLGLQHVPYSKNIRESGPGMRGTSSAGMRYPQIEGVIFKDAIGV